MHTKKIRYHYTAVRMTRKTPEMPMRTWSSNNGGGNAEGYSHCGRQFGR
jgi:hypothetical protein